VGRVRLGTQSWNFRAWVGPFYPVGTAAVDMLQFYSRIFDTIEVDASFYGIPAEPVLENWRSKVPESFAFSLKVPQQVTHELRLVDAESVLERFVQRVRVLEKGLGALLIQLSPDFLPGGDERAALNSFLTLLPRDLKWAIEFRHGGWLEPDVLSLLRSHGVALALTDSRWHRRDRMMALAENPTADFAYVRWMGPGRHLTDFSKPQIDRDADLDSWAEMLKSLALRVETIYGYFNNQFQGHAPHSAREMQRRLGLESVAPATLHPQTELF
jgi:uncharacterized protein YecE (DUF72 family)